MNNGNNKQTTTNIDSAVVVGRTGVATPWDTSEDDDDDDNNHDDDDDNSSDCSENDKDNNMDNGNPATTTVTTSNTTATRQEQRSRKRAATTLTTRTSNRKTKPLTTKTTKKKKRTTTTAATTDDEDEEDTPAAAPATGTAATTPPTRKPLTLAKDVDQVLRKCRDLRQRQQQQQIREQTTTTTPSLLSSYSSSVLAFHQQSTKKKSASTTTTSTTTDMEESKKTIKNKTCIGTAGDGSGSGDGHDASTTMMDTTNDNIVEVQELSCSQVLDGIEAIALNVTRQILATTTFRQQGQEQQQQQGQYNNRNHNNTAMIAKNATGSTSGGGGGFVLNIPSRASTNQIYIPEWDRIVLGSKRMTRHFLNVKECRKTAITIRVLELLHAVLDKRIHITKRDLFYTDVKLFVDQSESDHVLDDVATMIGCTRSNLHVVASDKGLVVGRVSFTEDGDWIDCTRMGVGGKAIPPYIDKIDNITSDAEFILLVEKEAAYLRLAEDRFYQKYPCIVITAKGQPDVATRMFLSRLVQELHIPVLGLVDSDPYGLKILSVYMSGSKNMSYDSASLTTKHIHWLGLRPSDLNKYILPSQCRLTMTEYDIKTGKELLQEEFIQKNPSWMKELQLMVKTKTKAEIQALSSFGFQYITETYLPQKLKEGDWI